MDIEKNRERPLDCSTCIRKLCTKYTEVGYGKVQSEHYMCKECPILAELLSKPTLLKEHESLAQLSCGTCKTSLLEIKHGGALGCRECYDVFETHITSQLKEEQRLQTMLEQTATFHLGHKPGEFKEFGESQKLFALNETLNEMIHREDYEQAASIRDKIKELKKNQK